MLWCVKQPANHQSWSFVVIIDILIIVNNIFHFSFYVLVFHFFAVIGGNDNWLMTRALIREVTYLVATKAPARHRRCVRVASSCIVAISRLWRGNWSWIPWRRRSREYTMLRDLHLNWRMFKSGRRRSGSNHQCVPSSRTLFLGFCFGRHLHCFAQSEDWLESDATTDCHAESL